MRCQISPVRTQNLNNSGSFKLMRRGSLDQIKMYRTLPTVLEAIYRFDYTEFFLTPLEEAQESHFVFPTIEKRSFETDATSVADPDPPDPHVFGPPPNADPKIGRKTLFPTIL